MGRNGTHYSNRNNEKGVIASHYQQLPHCHRKVRRVSRESLEQLQSATPNCQSQFFLTNSPKNMTITKPLHNLEKISKFITRFCVSTNHREDDLNEIYESLRGQTDPICLSCEPKLTERITSHLNIETRNFREKRQKKSRERLERGRSLSNIVI